MEKLLRTKTDKKQFLKWIEALKSRKFKQTEGTLEDRKGFCCLGVGCRVLIAKSNLKLDESNMLVGGLAEDQVKAPNWFKKINDDMRYEAGISLVNLNDEKKLTFGKIANKLLSTYKKQLEAIK